MDTNNIIDSITASKILIWVITILVTGFIAQFGKKFANVLMEKIKNSRKRNLEKIQEEEGHTCKTAVLSPSEPRQAGLSEDHAEKARLKLEKKKAKAAAKKQKKKT